MNDPRTRLIALLVRLGAEDLAQQLWLVRNVRELPADVRGQMLDVIGHHAAQCGLSRDGTGESAWARAGRTRRRAARRDP
jgi:hypothetical protein